MSAVLLLMLVFAVSAGNFAIGFGLAVYFGQGPDISRWFPKKPAPSPAAAHANQAAH